MVRSLKAFIFDLDGVITDTAEYHFLAWKALAEELGISFTREDNEQLKGVSRMDSLEKILELGSRTGDFSADEKQALAEKKNEHYLTLIQNITPDDLLPAIKELIADIKTSGLKLGLASASKNAFTVMESLGLKAEFDGIVDAKTVAHGKPHPEVFLRAAEMLGVEPEACISIEDAAAGIQAIKAAGMFAVAVGPKESFENADIVYASTAELSLEKIIEVYNG
ncbi:MULTISPECIES: beta-phosphoglucomutase [Mesobacillus]|uniref:Beta-phosphoglucomutase n=2 Tax=Mesobacillus TaxID=2675231 RepID=A0A0D6Z9J0_9BACI|nr:MULTISPECIES: beta-phosphoglucomutase [Mesobacillus]KIY22015.1 beta-phosphoglucomutase [Mesobacillus subterraneus]MDQ0414103.1 beta-phosphoglucomutase [Mesobacillus stamsii]